MVSDSDRCYSLSHTLPVHKSVCWHQSLGALILMVARPADVNAGTDVNAVDVSRDKGLVATGEPPPTLARSHRRSLSRFRVNHVWMSCLCFMLHPHVVFACSWAMMVHRRRLRKLVVVQLPLRGRGRARAALLGALEPRDGREVHGGLRGPEAGDGRGQ